jgi:hypothetical protein
MQFLAFAKSALAKAALEAKALTAKHNSRDRFILFSIK